MRLPGRFLFQFTVFVVVMTITMRLFGEDRPLQQVIVRNLVAGLIAVSLTVLLPPLLRRAKPGQPADR